MARRTERRCEMSGPQKAQSPAATGLSATNKADTKILTLAALKAGFQRRGAIVKRSANGGFLVIQWGLVRHCADLGALIAFAQQMGAA